MNDMVIYFVRHGQTEKNRDKVLQGRSNDPLNDAGKAQAEQAAEYFRRKGIIFDHVFSSPLSRAMETAGIIAGDLPVTTDERLLEMDYGPYEGSSLDHPAPEIIYFFSDFVHHPAPEGMESLSEVTARLGGFLTECSGNRSLKGNILVTTHAIAMKGALEYLTPESHGSYWSKYIGNCAVYRTEVNNGVFTVPEEINTRSGRP